MGARTVRQRPLLDSYGQSLRRASTHIGRGDARSIMALLLLPPIAPPQVAARRPHGHCHGHAGRQRHAHEGMLLSNQTHTDMPQGGGTDTNIPQAGGVGILERGQHRSAGNCAFQQEPKVPVQSKAQAGWVALCLQRRQSSVMRNFERFQNSSGFISSFL